MVWVPLSMKNWDFERPSVIETRSEHLSCLEKGTVAYVDGLSTTVIVFADEI